MEPWSTAKTPLALMLLALLVLASLLAVWVLALADAFSTRPQPRLTSRAALDRMAWLVLLAILSPALTLLYLVARKRPEPVSLVRRRGLVLGILGLGLLFNLPGLAPLWWEPFAPWTPVKLTHAEKNHGMCTTSIVRNTDSQAPVLASRSPRTFALGWEGEDTAPIAGAMAKALRAQGCEVILKASGPLPEGSRKPDFFLYLHPTTSLGSFMYVNGAIVQQPAPPIRNVKSRRRFPFFEGTHQAYTLLATEEPLHDLAQNRSLGFELTQDTRTFGLQGRTSQAREAIAQAFAQELVKSFAKFQIPVSSHLPPGYQRADLPVCLQRMNPQIIGLHASQTRAFDGTWRLPLPAQQPEALLLDLAQRLPQEGWTVSQADGFEIQATRASHQLLVTRRSSGRAEDVFRDQGFLKIHLQSTPLS